MENVQQRIARAQAHCLISILDGLLRPTQKTVGKAQLAVSINKAGVKRKAPLPFNNGLLEALLCQEHQGLGMVSSIGVRVNRERPRHQFVGSPDISFTILALNSEGWIDKLK